MRRAECSAVIHADEVDDAIRGGSRSRALRSLWRRWTFDRPQTDGGADGLHKYMLDYYSSAADYELPEKYVGESFVQDMLFSRSYRFVTG